jgi:maleate isomerase
MVDTLGWRRLYGVVTPSTNTVVQPEYDDMRPKGVTNHIARMHIPDDPVRSDADFDELIRRIDVALEAAVDRVMTCRPHHLILGISAESIWGGGSAPSKKIAARIRARAGDIPITQAADAVPAALKALGVKKRIGLVTPYFPTAEKHLRAFFDECGYEIAKAVHLSCTSPVLIAHVSRETLFAAIDDVNGLDVDAIVQFGANLPMGQVAVEAETVLGKPVIAVNTATYWHALRTGGITDKMAGKGRLLAEH